MWNAVHCSEFLHAMDKLQCNPYVQQEKRVPQHVAGVSCFDHSLFVAYLSFVVCRFFGWDAKSAARGAMLHDLHLVFDWHASGVPRLQRLWLHPRLALENALQLGLNETEQNIIASHMWPWPGEMPRCPEAWVVSWMDKLAAAIEFLHLYHVTGIKKNVCALCGECKKGVCA